MRHFSWRLLWMHVSANFHFYLACKDLTNIPSFHLVFGAHHPSWHFISILRLEIPSHNPISTYDPAQPELVELQTLFYTISIIMALPTEMQSRSRNTQGVSTQKNNPLPMSQERNHPLPHGTTEKHRPLSLRILEHQTLLSRSTNI